MKSIQKVSVYSDGGARGNPGPAAYGVLVLDAEGNELRQHRDYLGEGTNNIAEYSGLIKALELACELGAKEVDAYLDSELVVRQLTGLYRVKQPHLRTLFDKAKAIEVKFDKVTYAHLPRTHEYIQIADQLVNDELDAQAGY